MQPATTINGRYITSELLGGGGMAQVFLARDEVLERDVAVKVLREQYAEDEEFVERFRREALGVASLSHPNIVQVFDRGVSEEGRYYIAMEYVPGGTLKDRIVREGPLPPDTALAVAVQTAEALGAAHERGLIHRDVKPQNVLVTLSGDVKVADFGIARAAAAAVISATSAVLGTAMYMSPEQAMGREVGPPSDLYSLGVVLYEMLTGELPFEADTPVAISMKHLNEPPRPPRELRGEIPEEIEAVVLKLLAKDPGARYPGAAALVADLNRVAAGLAPVVEIGREAQTEPLRPAPGGPAPGGRGPQQRFARILIPLFLLVLMGAAGWGLLAGPNLGDIMGSLEGVPDRAISPSSVKVPDVERLGEAAARRRLDEAGLGTAVENRRSKEEDAGQVLEQSVPAGKKVEEGSRILLAISSGPGDQQGAAPQSDPGGQPRDAGDAGGSGAPPNPEGIGGSDSGVDTASPEPAPAAAAPDAEQEADQAAPAPAEPSSEPLPREDPAPAPSSPETAPTPSSPEPESPTPSSPEPSSPGPSSPEPASPSPSSPDPSEPQDSSASPSSAGPSSAEAARTGSPSSEGG